MTLFDNFATFHLETNGDLKLNEWIDEWMHEFINSLITLILPIWAIITEIP